ncbi:MAG TPA: alanine--glyoxylate aminotransferase family protein [Thermoanaerobaculia bacterium]|nr:alanine--glyoxylate aminotransferase family protein [Thermoanaerobaculia bacterium]
MSASFDPTGGKPGQVRFFLPGPVWVRDAVRQAMAHEAIGHRGKAFSDLYSRIPPRLARVFRTKGFVFTTTSAGTGLWEAALLNLAPSRILALVGGAFSERWAQCARDLGFETDVLETPWGAPVDAGEVRRALGKARYEAVTIVHSETSTGTLNDLAAIAQAVRESSEAFVLADVVTSVAGSPVECDAWGLDFALSGSQKALALPPGLGVAFASDRFRARAKEKSRAHYLRLSEAEAFAAKNQTPYTPSTPHLFALDVQLDHILTETIEGRWARHDALRSRVARWAAERGHTYAPPEGARSWTVSCLAPRPGVPAEALVAKVKERGFTIGGGYGKWKASTFRIGHMGDVDLASLEALLGALDESAAEAAA